MVKISIQWYFKSTKTWLFCIGLSDLVIIRYNGELLVFCQGQNHAGMVLNVRWYERKLGEMHQVHNLATLIVLFQTLALLWEKGGRHKMTPFIWKSDTFLSNGIPIIFPHTKSKKQYYLLAHERQAKCKRQALCVNICWSLSKCKTQLWVSV